MKGNKKFQKMSLAVLSAALGALGFGACSGGEGLTKQQIQQLIEQRDRAEATRVHALSQIGDRNAALKRMQTDYENIGRGACVYGGPNNMAEAVQRLKEQNDAERRRMQEKMDVVQHEIDSLYGVVRESEATMGQIDSKLNSKKK
ncbi:MAG: hypothetical protein K6A98_02200 [Prevotella sp.]|jgi:hypothetical protein|nr:hypothetical protein [Prevotella sp.]